MSTRENFRKKADLTQTWEEGEGWWGGREEHIRRRTESMIENIGEIV